VDIKGNAYYFGCCGQNTHEMSPILLNIENVIKIQICFKFNYQCLVLTEEDNVFLFDIENKNIIKKVKDDVLDINNNLLQTEECIYVFEKSFELMKTNFIDFFDYFNKRFNSTPKTIHIKTEEKDEKSVKYLTTNDIQWNENENNFILFENNVFKRKYENSFDIIDKIGQGGFGKIYEVEDKINQDKYAIKVIELKGLSIFLYQEFIFNCYQIFFRRMEIYIK
jgi:uncharacterized UPF0146 family protein